MAGELMRRSTGLTPAHRELIRMLAAFAVCDYLEEIETADVVASTDTTADVLRQAARRAT